MKFSQLIRHLETKHPNHATKTLEFFRRRETSLECQILILPDVSTERTSLIWSCTWNCQAKNLTRLENTLVNPVCWKEYNYFLKKVVRQTWDKYLFPAVLFRGAFQICRKDVKDQVINEMKASPTPMLFVDESTDVTSCAQLLVFATYIHSGDIKRGVPVLWGTTNCNKCRCSGEVKFFWLCRVAVNIW